MSDDSPGPSPVRRSVAEAGEVATLPTDGEAIFEAEVTDLEDSPAGLLIEWTLESENMWIWAQAGSYGPTPQ